MHKNNSFFWAITFMLASNLLMAQNFSHIENIAGLGQLEENNGVAVADIDNDNDLDIFVVAKSKEKNAQYNTFSRLFRNDNNGSFTDITESSGLTNLLKDHEVSDNHPGLEGHKYAACWGDYNNDGLQDIFFTHMYKVQLFKNLGNNTFTEVTTDAGIEKTNDCYLTSATWTDYNNDGFLDIYINEWGECSEEIFYRNNRNNTFTRIDIENENFRSTFNMLPFDFNNDGFKDFYITADLHGSNILYINQQDNTFIEQANTFGLNNNFDDMSISMGDINQDGALDIFITGINENALLENQGDNTFTNVTEEHHISGTGWAWGARFADFDLDGDEDLFIVNGFRHTQPQNNVYYKNLHTEGGNGFMDFSMETNLGEVSKSMESVEFDYDNDGDLDVFVSCLDRPSFFYENNIINQDNAGKYNWIKITLEGTTSNRNAFGTTVSVKTVNGTFKKYFSGVGMLSQSIIPLHFGLHDATIVEELEISWPSGLVEKHQNIPAKVLVKAKEGSGYHIINQMPAKKVSGCTDSNSCNYNPLATLNDGSCLYLEPKHIEGATTSSFNSEERYFYNKSEQNEIVWHVRGGEIISGNNTKEIIVRWGLETKGVVTVIEKNESCQTLPIELNVDIKIESTDHLSIARIWNEALLEAIRNDYARPTVHARNLFHTSVAMYDAWAVFDSDARPYLIGNTVNNFSSEFTGFTSSEDSNDAISKAISYAAYKLLSYRFRNSPGHETTQEKFDLIMEELEYDINYGSLDYSEGDVAALGNFIGQTLIEYGIKDGSREITDFDNAYYSPVNTPLDLSGNTSGSILITNPNRWQPLSFNTFLDQSENIIRGITPEFLTPEWGNVYPFALTDDAVSNFQRNGNSHKVFYDPGTPPYLDTENNNESSELYKWNFSLVSIWSSHLDPNDGVIWDISPNSIGNIALESLPQTLNDHNQFYNLLDGGDIGKGYSLNPRTNQPYETQLVPRADYTRVLAEFWADGPDSETPPGHWFTILNYVSDHPQFTRKFNGEGEVLKQLEWDVKSYFVLGGAMHDAAMSAWSIKGWYDYIRPISAIRYMCSLGQSSKPELSNYHVGGIPLTEGFVEVIEESDELAGTNAEHIGKIKLYAWKGHDYINDPRTDAAGVGWILAENWWPYQRPSFVTPPFAGYVSGHSTFSRAAAEVMTLITGDEYFPGGMGEFVAKKNEFLVFEEGPSQDVILQWATYRDASDQCSLSRIWGGIHPPADDIPGRLIGEKVGVNAYNFAVPYFSTEKEEENINEANPFFVYPVPIESNKFYVKFTQNNDAFQLFDIRGRSVNFNKEFLEATNTTLISVPKTMSPGIYVLKVNGNTKLLVSE